jgi:ADP-ribosylglycohydrolase
MPLEAESKTGGSGEKRLELALLSLEGLSVGDAFGECFFCEGWLAQGRIDARSEPPPPWFLTDDSIMAISVVETLAKHGQIEQSHLATRFATRYKREPGRGYGSTASRILGDIASGVEWRQAASGAFDGQGSMGNGGAMRAGPIGAYLGDAFGEVVKQAKLSAEVTHTHAEGQAGAVAIAIAAAWAASQGLSHHAASGRELMECVIEFTPEGETRRRLVKAMRIPFECEAKTVAASVGSGNQVLAHDTVPFAIWCAARHLSDFTEALWTTVSGFGDRDTTCAMVGSIVAVSAGHTSLPVEWRAAREPLKFDL